jgi:hypothetical protein
MTNFYDIGKKKMSNKENKSKPGYIPPKENKS